MKILITVIVISFAAAMFYSQPSSAHGGGKERGTSCHHHRNSQGKQVPGSRHCVGPGHATGKGKKSLSATDDDDGISTTLITMGVLVGVALIQHSLSGTGPFEYSPIEKVSDRIEVQSEPGRTLVTFSISFD